MGIKKKLQIAVVDEGPNAPVSRAVLRLIRGRYNVELTKDYTADYVIHSCSGYEVLKYSGIRIYVTGECVSPNFNISDYAMGFDHMEFADRYHWLPLLRLYSESYRSLQATRQPADAIIAQNRKFCAYVMSNTRNSAKERSEIFETLSKYKTVSSGGKWRNNVGGPVANKIEFQSKYKFTLALENYSMPGYLTEKFAQAAQSGCIPIYWGDPEIGKYFNEKAFVNCHKYKNLDEAIDRIIEIDQDDNLYRTMLSEPWFYNEEEPEVLREDTILDFLSKIFERPIDVAYKRNRSRWGEKYENRLFNMFFRPHKQLLTLVRLIKKRGYKKTNTLTITE